MKLLSSVCAVMLCNNNNKNLDILMAYSQDQQTFSLKGQVVNILSFVDHKGFLFLFILFFLTTPK